MFRINLQNPLVQCAAQSTWTIVLSLSLSLLLAWVKRYQFFIFYMLSQEYKRRITLKWVETNLTLALLSQTIPNTALLTLTRAISYPSRTL